jgi:hypothetical protein
MRTTHPPRNLLRCAAILAAMSLAGCALHPEPVQQLAGARDAISSAALAGAETQAIEELARARGKLALAGRWLAAQDNEPATWLAEQAGVDAELAGARAAALQAQSAVLLARRSAPSLLRTASSN